MPQNVTETETWTSPLSAVADGDAVNAATWLAAIQGYANRLKFIGARLYGSAADVMPVPLVCLNALTTSWFYGQNLGALTTGVAQQATGSAFVAIFELPLLKKATLTNVRVVLVGAAAHPALPATMPKIRLYRQATGVNTAPVQIGSDATDGSASTAAYQAAHEVALTGLSETIGVGYRYLLWVYGETGANALPGLTVNDIYCGVTA